MLAVGATNLWLNDPPPIEPLRLRRLPMLAAAVCFACGDLLGLHWHGTLLLLTATVALLLLALVSLHKAPRIALIPTLAVWVALGCWCAQLQPPVPTQQALTHFADGLSRIVRGRIVRVRTLAPEPDLADSPQPTYADSPGWEPPEPTPDKQPHQSIDLAVESVEDISPDTDFQQPLTGGVRITFLGTALPLTCGDLIELPLRLRTPELYRDPGAWSYADQLLTEGIGALASAKPDKLQPLSHAPGALRCRLFAAQTWASSRLDSYLNSAANRTTPAFARLTPEDAAMLNAMLFGDRTRITPSLRSGFERTGTFHLFVVSGLHVALLCGALFWVLRRLRMPEAPAALLTVAATTAYALLTGFGVPVQRALAMAALYLLARTLGRQVSALNALGTAALVVLAFDPRALYQPAFQMTFLVILAVAGLAGPLHQRLLRPRAHALHQLDVIRLDATLHPTLAQFRVRLRMATALSAALLGKRLRNIPVWLLRLLFHVADLVLVSLAAEACMVLPMALYFHRATLFALPVNLIDIPLVAALVCSSVVFFVTSLLNPWLAQLPAAFTGTLLHSVHATVERAQRFTLSDLRVPAPAPPAIVAACAALVFCCWALRQRRKTIFLAGIAAIVLVPLAVLWPAPPLLHPGVLEVTALDVGQGDSLLVVSPQGHTLLVDAGGPVGLPALTATSRWDVGEEVVAPALWSRRIRRLDAVLLTHAHSDHMGGMPAVLRDLRPRELWLSLEPTASTDPTTRGELNSPGLAALLSEAKSLGTTVRCFRAGDAFPWGGLQATVLAPEPGYTNPGTATNNDSLVLRLAYGKSSVLLAGDAEALSEAAMLTHHRVQPSTLLKVGHHGSRTSTNPAFLAAVAPQDAVISVGIHNTFGHPRAEILQRLQDAHTRTYRTDRHGAETFLLTPDGKISSQSTAQQ